MFRKLNKLVIFSEKEYTLHLICKAIIAKHLLSLGRKHISTEYILPSGKIADVCDLEQRVFYEVERHPDKGYYAHVNAVGEMDDYVPVVINLEKVPKEIKESITKLEAWLTEQIA